MRLLFLLMFSVNSYAQYNCGVTQVKIGDSTNLPTELCYNEIVDTVFSPDCKNNDCEVYQNLDNNIDLVESLDFESEYGNPTIYICAKFGNIVETVELSISGKSYSISWCRKGDSIVDLGSFFMYFNRIRKK